MDFELFNIRHASFSLSFFSCHIYKKTSFYLSILSCVSKYTAKVWKLFSIDIGYEPVCENERLTATKKFIIQVGCWKWKYKYV